MDPCNGNDEFETKPDTACGLDYDALCWALVEEEKSLFNKPRKEDFRQRQRRMQTEYTNALATLRIKSVTFHSTIYQADSEKVRTNCGSNITLFINLFVTSKNPNHEFTNSRI